MREQIIQRLMAAIGLPLDTEEAASMLPAVLLAWSDGNIDDKEVVAIKRRAEAMGLSDSAIAAVYRLLERHPGPYFPHRVLHLLNAMRERVPAEERSHWARDLEDSAEHVAQAGHVFTRIFGLSAGEKEELARLADALERSQPAVIDERLHRLVTVSALRVAGLPALAAEGARVEKVVHCEMGQDGPIQALGIQVEVPGWEPLLVVCIEQFATGGELSRGEVAQILAHTAHLPLIERWISIRLAVQSLSRPLGRDDRERLVGMLDAASDAHVHEATLPELADLEDQLARGVGWTSWLAGKVAELRIDRTRIRRSLAPGTADIPADEHRSRVVRTDERPVEGLRFPVLAIEGPDGAALRLATPEVATDPPAEAACTWIGRFLPVLRDPRSVVLLDDGDDVPHWTVEMRSGMADGEAGPAVVEPLPEGRALVVPPWVWLRCCWALGVDPNGAS